MSVRVERDKSMAKKQKVAPYWHNFIFVRNVSIKTKKTPIELIMPVKVASSLYLVPILALG